jgi:hypothetical protein
MRPEPPPQAGQIDSDADEGSPTVQIPPSAAAVILAASVSQNAAPAMPGPPSSPPQQPHHAPHHAPHHSPPSASTSLGARAVPQPSASMTGPRAPVPVRAPVPTPAPPSAQPVAEADVEDTETSKRQPPIAIYAGIGIGVLLVIVLVASLIGGGGGTPVPPTEQVATADTAAPPVSAAVGTIQLDVKPANARVTINGVEFPGNSPRLIGNLAPGTHKLVAQDEGYLPFEQDIPISAGQQLSLPVKLQVRDVTLTIKTTPPDATVKLVEAGSAPTLVGKGGESFKLVRKPGVVYRLLVEAAGFDPSEVPLSFSGEASDSPEVVLVKSKGATPPVPVPPNGTNVTPPVDKPKPPPVDKPKPKAKTAELKIGSAPGRPPATVWVDNQKQAKPTPVTVMVAPGPHTIKWKYPDGKTETRKINATDGAQVIKGTP